MKSRKSGLILSYGYFVLSAVVSIFVSSFVIRSIGKTDYGVYQAIAAFINYLTLLEFGTGRIMSRNISLLKKDGSEDLEMKKNISTVIVLNSGLMLLILAGAVCFWLSLGAIYQNSMSPEQIVMAKRLFFFPVASLGISFFQQSFNGILIGYEQYTFEKIVSIIKLVVRTLLLAVILSIRSSIYLYVIIDTAVNLMAFLVTVLYVRLKMKVPVHFGYFDRQILKSILPLCFAMLLQGLVNTMNNTLDKFLIGVMMTPEDVTIYSIAMTVYSMFSTIACLPMGMYMPAVAKDMRNGLRGKELTKTLLRPCRFNILITGLIVTGFAVAGRQFIVILYGEEFLTAWYCAMIVMVPMFLNTANDIVINVLDILKKRHVRSVILMGTTALNLVLTIWGIQHLGMIGASLATGIATLLQVIILNIYYQKKIEIDVLYLFRKGFAGTIPCMLVAVLAAVPVYFLVKNVYLSFFTCGAVFLVVFALGFYFWGADASEKQAAHRLVNKLKFRRNRDV